MARIGICGAHGTGKSTLCHGLVADLKRQGWDIGLVPEVARLCPFPLDVDQSKGEMNMALLWLMNAQQNAELETMSRHEHIVCDRTVVDRVAYANIFGEPFIHSTMIALATMWLKFYPYSCILKTPLIDSYMIADRLRNTDANLQAKTDDAIAVALKKMDIMYHCLPRERGDECAISIALDSLTELE